VKTRIASLLANRRPTAAAGRASARASKGTGMSSIERNAVTVRRHAKAPSAGSTKGASRASRGRGRIITAALLGILGAFLACGVASAFAATYVAGTPPTFCTGTGAAAGQCEEQRAVAVDQTTGNVYAVDANGSGSANFRVSQYSSSGTFIRGFGVGVVDGSPVPQICTTTCVQGKSSGAAGAIGTAPRGIAVDPNTHIVYVVAGSAKVAYYNGTTGGFLGEFVAAGSPGPGQIVASPPAPEAFVGNAGIAVDSSGSQHYLYVATGNGSSGPFVIDKFKVPDPSTSTPPAYLCQITGKAIASASECHGTASKDGTFEGLSYSGQAGAVLAADSSGNVYVAEEARNVVSMFDSTGARVKGIAATAPVAVASGSSGKIFVADRGTVAGGEKVEEFEVSTGSATGEISLPTATNLGVAVDASGLGSNGSVYVADRTGKQLRKYVPLILRALSIVKNGTGFGEVKCKFNGGPLENCSSPQQNGTLVQVVATEDSGSTLASVSGTGSASGCNASPCSFTIEADSSVTVTFNLQPGFKAFSVVKTGTGTGAVECKVGAGSFGPCGSAYAEGTSVSVQATPASGSSFTSLSTTGGTSTTCAGSTNPCEVVIGANNVTATAQFTLIPRTLSIVKNGTGGGEVECKFNNAGPFGPCASPQPNGTVVRVRATPDAHSELSALTGNGSASGCAGSPCVFTIEANTTVTATFDLAGRNLTIVKVGTGNGTFECKVNAGSFGACVSTYIDGQTIVIKALPNPQSLFQGWTGCSSSAGNECTIAAINANTTVTAAFTPLPVAPKVPTLDAIVYHYGTTAIFAGTVNPNNSPIGYHFEYVDDAGFQANGFAGATSVPSPDASAGFGGTPVYVAKEVTGLTAGTTYHLRLVATNGAGSAVSIPTTFTVSNTGNCANESIRAEQGPEVKALPQCMALEMVSPPQKFEQGTSARNPEVSGQITGISANGERMLYFAKAALGGTPILLHLQGDPYIATRGPSGWTTTYTSPPTSYTKGGGPYGFDPEYSSWVDFSATAEQGAAGQGQVFQAGLGGRFSPLSPLLSTIEGVGGAIGAIQGVSADQSHAYWWPFNSERARFFANDPTPGPAFGTAVRFNTYVARLDAGGNPSLELLARDSQGKVWGGNCGTGIGGDTVPTLATGNNHKLIQGAISADGSRVFFMARPTQPSSGNCEPISNRTRILERRETPSGPTITEPIVSQCNRTVPTTCNLSNGDDVFNGASLDGSKVYFTTSRQLTNSDLDTPASAPSSSESCSATAPQLGCDLYLYDANLPAGQRLIQVSAGDASDPTPGEGAKVYNSVTSLSADGSHVYFAAQGVLTAHPNPEGALPVSGSPNLYLYERDAENPNGRLSFIGTLAGADSGELWGNQSGSWKNDAYPVPVTGKNTAGEEVGGDGHILVFETSASLSAQDTDGGKRDVYRYDSSSAQPALECVSCRPGSPDAAPFDVAPRSVAGANGSVGQGPDFAEMGRWVDESGKVIVFVTAEGMSPGESSGTKHAYLWDGGELSALPGSADTGALFDIPVLSHDGSEAAFRSSLPLLPQDGDSVADVYMARTGGGFTVPVSHPCAGEACQEPFRSQPGSQEVGSETKTEGNPPSPVGPAKCRKGFVRRHGKCVKKHAHHKKHAHRKTHNQTRTRPRTANPDRRAAK
jgi:hypothetical protein